MVTEVQLSLDIDGVSPTVVHSHAHRAASAHVRVNDRHIAMFEGRLAATGSSTKTMGAYVYQMRQLLQTARRLGLPERDGVAEIFQDEKLLGAALTCEFSAGGAILSCRTLAQRRGAVRSFARLMRPELRHFVAEPEIAVVNALRRVARRVGGGYCLTGGRPGRSGGPAPSPAEITSIIHEAGRAPGFVGKRNQAFFRLLRESRVNALRQMEGAAIVVLPSGRVRLLLHAKGRTIDREVELSLETATLVAEYAAEFNREMTRRGQSERIGPGESGPFWRSSQRGPWSYRDVLKTFERACLTAGVPAYRLHSLRRAFASAADSVLPRSIVALAGGWQGTERLDNFYIRPRADAIWRKLTGDAPDLESTPLVGYAEAIV